MTVTHWWLLLSLVGLSASQHQREPYSDLNYELTRPNYNNENYDREATAGFGFYTDNFECGGCRCSPSEFPTHAFCNNTEADSFPSQLPPAIKVLNLDNNIIKRLDGMLSMYSQLEDLSIRNNQIGEIEPGIFSDHERLSFLDLSNNRIGRLTDFRTFQGLSGLTELYLKGNRITEVSGDAFRSLQRLRRLDLSANRIQTLGSTVFQANSQLQSLHIRSNNFRQVPSEAFVPLTNLADLDLSDNTFSTLGPHPFSSLSQLVSLNLHGCSLNDLDQAAFSNLTGLKHLDISNNFLDYIPGGSSLNKLDHLEVLRAGSNRLTEIKEFDMSALTNLKYLVIDGCSQGRSPGNAELEIHPNAFLSNTKLVQVNITKCPSLKELRSGTFKYLPDLKILNFHGSGIEKLAVDSVDWTSLRWLDLTANALRCDCDLRFLTNLAETVARSGNRLDIPDVRCAEPDDLRGKLLSRVGADLARKCGDSDGGNSGTRLEVVIGACVGALVIAVLVVAVACFLARKKREKNQRGLVNNTHHWQSPPMRGDTSSDSSKLSQACWACDWTKRRQGGRGRNGLKRPKKPIIKSDIRVNTLTVTDAPPGFIDVKVPEENETENLYEAEENIYEEAMPIGPRSNYPDIKTTVL